MTENTFSGLGPFADGLTNAQRGKLALRLTKACSVVREAAPAAQALGSLFDPTKRDQARDHLNAMPDAARKAVLARYAHLSRLSRD